MNSIDHQVGMKQLLIPIAAILICGLSITQTTAQFSLTNTIPERNASAIPINQLIILEFSEPLDPISAQGSFKITSNLRGPVSGLITTDNNTLTFQPFNDFYYGEEITITVLQTLESVFANPLTIPASLRFTTLIKESLSTPAVFVDYELFSSQDLNLQVTEAADFDLDGDIDFVYGANSVYGWLENNGDNDYTNHEIGQQYYSIHGIKVIDIDCDGDMDVLAATLSEGISLLVNDGLQNFMHTSLTSNIHSLSLDVADFDSNGFPDIVFSNVAPGIQETFILYNQGGNVFSLATIGNTRAYKTRVADIDKDGDWDIVLQGDEGIYYLLNSGSAFTENIIYSGDVSDIAIADFDNDGDLDIASVENELMKMYVNNGEFQFTPKLIGTSEFSILVAGDLDGDNDVDLVIPDYTHFNFLINDGLNNFNSIEVQNSRFIASSGFNPHGIGTGDVDRDGDLDIFSVINDDQIKWYKNTSLSEAYPLSVFPYNFKSFTNGDSDWGDFDNDGDLDLLMIGIYENVPSTVLYENQNGMFVEKQTAMPGLYAGDCGWGDYDNDGDLDILLMGALETSLQFPNPATYIYTNENGVFSLLPSSVIQLPRAYGGKAQWADFNNDGWLDIAFNAGGFSGIYQSDGKGNFLNKFILPFLRGSLDCADYDHDGDLDIAISGPVLGIFRNNGNWNFSEAQGDLINHGGGNLNWADMDNDGDLDLVISGPNNPGGSSTIVYLNNGGVFNVLTNSELLYYTDGAGTAETGDFDNDGFTDVIASTRGGSSYFPDLTLLKNDGLGDLKAFNIELPNIVSRVANWVDFDQDHDLDIFVQSSLLQNNIEIKNNPPSPPTVIQFDSVFNNSIYFHWNEGDDLENGPSGLSYQIYMGTQSRNQDIVNSNSSLLTGFRKIVELGNSKGKSTRVENLNGGIYFFGVQSIDASFEGSTFSPESQALVIGIHGNTGTCRGYDYSYTANPSGNYNWEVSGGIIISGQGTDSLVVNWNTLGVGSIKISNSQNIRNTLKVNVDEKPRPSIFGESEICTGTQQYTVADTLSYFTNWTVSGANVIQEESTHQATVNWNSVGSFELVAQTYPEYRGCASYDTLFVSVDQRPNPSISGTSRTCTDKSVQ